MKTFSAPELTQLSNNWSLTPKLPALVRPTIVVAGAYEGKLIRLLAEIYPDYKVIVGFEPQAWAFHRCIDNTVKLPRLHLMNHGLYAGNGQVQLAMGEFETDACSVFEITRKQGFGTFIDAVPQLREYLPIDLFIMNMEGYEYLLLPYLIKRGILQGVRNLAVQFHTKYQTPDFPGTMESIGKHFLCADNDFPRWMLWTAKS